jgi:hypothetical protein
MPTKLINASDVQYKMNNAICQSLSENLAANENKIADKLCSGLQTGIPAGRSERGRDRMEA